jgi:hypothetical protein
MIYELSLSLPNFPGEANRTRCFNHITNLVAKSMLKLFDIPKKKADQAITDAEKTLHELADDLDVDDLNTQQDSVTSTEEAEDNDEYVDELGKLPETEQAQFRERIRPVQLVLVKVSLAKSPNPMLTNCQMRKIAYKVVNSSTKLLPEWKKVVKELSLAEKLLTRDVSTRWNSTYDMLDTGFDYQPAVIKMTEPLENGLRPYELSSEEWRIVEQLRDVLKVGDVTCHCVTALSLSKILKDATSFFARGTPTLANVIPAMDHIDKQFATKSVDPAYDPAIRAALTMAKRTLNRYYDRTDHASLRPPSNAFPSANRLPSSHPGANP